MGAGILPVTVYKDKIYFLYGRESVEASSKYDKGKWSDFGGGREKGESAKQTAIREGFEETSGILGSEQDIADMIHKNLLKKLVYNDGKGTYTVFLVLMPYDKTLPDKLKKIYKNALKKEPKKVFAHNGLFEKDRAEWIPLHQLNSRMHTFRRWYKPIVRQTIELFN
jgi:8-oxo-dGTP pyrophosphatase MutT (NUDIX family)